jgi:hypothetical protein
MVVDIFEVFIRCQQRWGAVKACMNTVDCLSNLIGKWD